VKGGGYSPVPFAKTLPLPGFAYYSGTRLSLGTPPSLFLQGLLAKGKGRGRDYYPKAKGPQATNLVPGSSTSHLILKGSPVLGFNLLLWYPALPRDSSQLLMTGTLSQRQREGDRESLSRTGALCYPPPCLMLIGSPRGGGRGRGGEGGGGEQC
jgi:hypothetical protein